MRKTIRINDIKDVQVGDLLFVKGCSAGFRVAVVRANSLLFPVAVDNPFAGSTSCVSSDMFDHAERTVEEPEWPKPSDSELHIYLGSDGEKYLYLPICERDSTPWKSLPYLEGDIWMSADEITKCYPAALPLKELKLVPKEEES